MNKFVLFLIATIAVSCVPSRTIPETIDFTRDRRWSACRFYVVDHECGTISDINNHRECAFTTESEYIAIPSTQQRQWLREHGCPRGALTSL